MKHLVLALVAAATLSATQAVAQSKVKVSQVYTEAATLNMKQLQSTQQTVQLNRYLFAGYNTICLPMSMSAEQLAEVAGDVRIERLAAIGQEGSTLNLYFVECTAEGIEAGTPYLIYSPKAQYLRARNTESMQVSAELQTVRMSDAAGNTVSFGSSWESMAKEGRYGIPAKQDVYPLQAILVRTTADKTFLPTRCGFNWEMQSPTAENIEIKHLASASELTAISTVKAKSGSKVDVYDLNGKLVRRQVSAGSALNGLQRGVYVVGGEKVTVQ